MIFTVEAMRTQTYVAKIEADSREEAERIMRESLPIMRPDTEDLEIIAEVCPMPMMRKPAQKETQHA